MAWARADGAAHRRRGRGAGRSIAVVYPDEVVYLKSSGVREAGKDEAVDADTVFQLAPFLKPLASTVVAAIVGDEVVSWNFRVADIGLLPASFW